MHGGDVNNENMGAKKREDRWKGGGGEGWREKKEKNLFFSKLIWE